jgi:hypothetical protein
METKIKARMKKDRIVEENRKLVEENRKLVEENRKLVEENKKLVEEHKQSSYAPDDNTPDNNTPDDDDNTPDDTEEINSSLNNFWNSVSLSKTPTQLDRYEKKKSPQCIKKFIQIGGGPKMGSTLEKYAKYKFNELKKKEGKNQTGYDHIIKTNNKTIRVEQKSSGHWGDDDYKWQHIEEKHNWDILILCGIDYKDIKFWAMNRKTFTKLISENKITNQGNKNGNSLEGRWFDYSEVKDFLVEIQDDEQLLRFANLSLEDVCE